MSKLSKLDISAEEMKTSQLDAGRFDGMKLKAKIDEIVKKHVEKAKAALATAGAAASKHKKKAMALGAAVLIAGTMTACTPSKEQTPSSGPSITSEQPISSTSPGQQAEATPKTELPDITPSESEKPSEGFPAGLDGATDVVKSSVEAMINDLTAICTETSCSKEEMEKHIQTAIDRFMEIANVDQRSNDPHFLESYCRVKANNAYNSAHQADGKER